MTDWQSIEAELKRRPKLHDAELDRVMAHVRATVDAPTIAHGALRAERAPLTWLVRPATMTMRPLVAVAAAVLVAVGAYAIGAARAGGPPRDGAPGATTGTPASRLASVAHTPHDAQPVQFVFVAPTARAVAIAGDFNDWSPIATPMRREGDAGVWSVVVPLAPGRHLYSFVVDGERWVPDATAPRASDNEFGTVNSVVLVEARS